MLSLQHILKNNKVWVLADQAVFSGTSFLTTILMARMLDPESFGMFASIVLFIYLAISMINAIVIQPLQVSLARVDDINTYLSFSFWLQLLIVVSVLLAALATLQIDIALLSVYSVRPTGILCFAAGFIFQDYFRKLFLAQALPRIAFFVDALTAVLQLGIIGYALFYQNLKLHQLLWYLGMAYAPSMLYGILQIRPSFSYFKKWKIYLIQHYYQGKWLFMTALVQWWSGNLFVVASGLFLGIKALGAFRLVQSLFGVLNLLLQTFENYALPQASRLLNNSPLEAKNYLKKISIKSAILFGGVLLTIFLLSEYIIVLAGGVQYTEYAFVVKGMVILYLFIFLGYPIRMAIRALVLNKHFFMGYLLSLGFGLLTFQYLLKEFHLMGAIAGLIFSQIILLVFWQFILTKNNFSLWK